MERNDRAEGRETIQMNHRQMAFVWCITNWRSQVDGMGWDFVVSVGKVNNCSSVCIPFASQTLAQRNWIEKHLEIGCWIANSDAFEMHRKMILGFDNQFLLRIPFSICIFIAESKRNMFVVAAHLHDTLDVCILGRYLPYLTLSSAT